MDDLCYLSTFVFTQQSLEPELSQWCYGSVLCDVAGIENMSSAALCELYDEMDSLVRELSEELVLELARRDELEYEKELKNQFISLLLSVQRRHRALVDSKLRGGSAAGNSKTKDTPCTGSSQPGCVSFIIVLPLSPLFHCCFIN